MAIAQGEKINASDVLSTFSHSQAGTFTGPVVSSSTSYEQRYAACTQTLTFNFSVKFLYVINIRMLFANNSHINSITARSYCAFANNTTFFPLSNTNGGWMAFYSPGEYYGAGPLVVAPTNTATAISNTIDQALNDSLQTAYGNDYSTNGQALACTWSNDNTTIQINSESIVGYNLIEGSGGLLNANSQLSKSWYVAFG